jgi:hypothetical protein
MLEEDEVDSDIVSRSLSVTQCEQLGPGVCLS